jgi:hypothetical protein
MSATSPCTPCCPTSQVVNVPGGPGTDGGDGTNGVDAFTLLTADMPVVPAIGSTVTVAVANSSWMVVDQIVIVTGPANFKVTALPGTTSATLEFLGYPGDVAPGTAILTGAKVSPAGLRGGGTLYYTTTAASIALTDFMDFIEVTADGKTMTLPTAVGRAGKVFTIKQTAAATAGTTIATAGGQTIDGLSTFIVQSQNDFVSVISNGANWDVIVRHTNHFTQTAVDLPADDSMDVIEITGATKIVTLPTAVGRPGKEFTIKLTANSTGTVDGNGAETIDGAANYALSAQYKFVQVVSNGTQFLIIGKN